MYVYFLLSRMLTQFLAHGVKLEVKLKQTLYRPGHTLWTAGVWSSQNSRQSTDEGGKQTEALQIFKDVKMYRYDIHRITYDKNVNTVATGFLSAFQLLPIKCSTCAPPLQMCRMSEWTSATASLFVILSSSTRNVRCFCDITLLRWVTGWRNFEGTQWLHLQRYRGLGS